MTRVLWDQVGERVFQTGVDRGVLYLPDNSGVVWNGLISVTEAFSNEVKPYYMEGFKYLETHLPGDYSSELKAFTYPDEFDEINGIVEDQHLYFHNQPPKMFGLTYRTLVGDDVDGTNRGYKIHILWNLRAIPTSIPYSSLSGTPETISFGWTLSGVPVIVDGRKPTCHISIDSTKIDPFALELIENMLYGTATSDPTLPSIQELIALDDLFITDNGDGTWTAVGSDHYISMLDPTTFQIANATTTTIDANTYTISTTIV